MTSPKNYPQIGIWLLIVCYTDVFTKAPFLGQLLQKPASVNGDANIAISRVLLNLSYQRVSYVWSKKDKRYKDVRVFKIQSTNEFVFLYRVH